MDAQKVFNYITANERARQLHTQQWNALIPENALDIDVDFSPTAVRYRHPTKGFRYVSKRRLGL